MSYGNLINDTFKVAGRYWWLWFFGFFISLGDAGGSLPQLSGRFKAENFDWTSPDWLPAIALGLVAFAAFVALVYLILKIFAECSLMVAVKDIGSGGRGAVADSFRRGLAYFWRILALWAMLFVLALMTIIICGGIIVLGFVATPIVGVMALLLILPIWLVLIFIVEVVAAWAYRAAVLDNQPVFEAIGQGWRLLREKSGPSIVVGLSAIGSQIVFGIVGLTIYAFVGIPFLVAGLINFWLGL
ncbi:MAG: hypothetical protein ABIJ61_09740, partial [bacterium]